MTSPPSSQRPPAARFTLLGVIGAVLTAFMFGLYFGSSFLGHPSAAPPPAAAGLPPGHPTLGPNAGVVPAPPLDPSQLPAGAPAAPATPAPPADEVTGQGMDPGFDDPAIRASIAAATQYDKLVRIGDEQFDAKHPKLAIAAYEKALKIHPFDPDVQTDLGVMYRAVHRTDDALNSFRKAASLDPRHLQSRYNIGVVLDADENDPKGAVQAWKEYLAIAPPGPQTDEVKRRLAALEARR